MDRREHLKIDRIIFGRPFDHVHKWLDSEAVNWSETEHSSYNHWVKHHSIESIDEKYSIEQVENNVAKLHVICDWLFHWGAWILPVNQDSIRKHLREYGIKVVA